MALLRRQVQSLFNTMNLKTPAVFVDLQVHAQLA
eukprot:COSAG01_NODE_40642_length_461_cov_0.947514_2_plen_33_part_01